MYLRNYFAKIACKYYYVSFLPKWKSLYEKKKKKVIIKNNIAIRIAGKVSRYIDASMNRATRRVQWPVGYSRQLRSTRAASPRIAQRIESAARIRDPAVLRRRIPPGGCDAASLHRGGDVEWRGDSVHRWARQTRGPSRRDSRWWLYVGQYTNSVVFVGHCRDQPIQQSIKIT